MRALRRLSLCAVVVVGLIILLSTTNRTEANPSPQFDDQLEQGEYLATIAGCISCHTPQLDVYDPILNEDFSLEELRTLALFEASAADRERLLSGGRPFDLGPAGIIYTANLTPDEETGLGSWSDEEIKLALQTGVNADGRRLHPVMPLYTRMAEEDLDALIAFLRSLEPIENEVEEYFEMPIPPGEVPEEPIERPDPEDLAARGEYLVAIMACEHCHTPLDLETGAPLEEKFLAGGQPYEGPWGIVYSGNITPHETGIGEWTEAEIKRAITTGVRINGRRLGLMPWQYYAALQPEDLDAIVHYLQNVVEPVENNVPATAMEEPFIEFVDAEGETTTATEN